MTLYVIGNVVNQAEVVGAVQREGAIEAAVSTQSLAVRFMNCTNHVEVNSITTNFECLTDIGELNVLEASNERVITLRVQEDRSSVLIV